MDDLTADKNHEYLNGFFSLQRNRKKWIWKEMQTRKQARKQHKNIPSNGLLINETYPCKNSKKLIKSILFPSFTSIIEFL